MLLQARKVKVAGNSVGAEFVMDSPQIVWNKRSWGDSSILDCTCCCTGCFDVCTAPHIALALHLLTGMDYPVGNPQIGVVHYTSHIASQSLE